MVKIRRGNIEDINSLVELRLNLLKEVGNIKDDTNIEELKKSSIDYFEKKIDNGFLFWVAEDNLKVIGISGLVFMERPPENGNLTGLEGYIMNIYIVPTYRHKGIAIGILKKMILFLKEMGVKRVWLHATEDGRIIYDKIGFKSKLSEMEMYL
ncbi:MAG TPA: GNAT family N-acetyltransferase [Pseudobacteroides sp.]|jgi:ribosomal protein S18 acetylase RimI-like enzyme|nr:GNAT family N-acetyltransferase [Pseudobacteroides sp.]